MSKRLTNRHDVISHLTYGCHTIEKYFTAEEDKLIVNLNDDGISMREIVGKLGKKKRDTC